MLLHSSVTVRSKYFIEWKNLFVMYQQLQFIIYIQVLFPIALKLPLWFSLSLQEKIQWNVNGIFNISSYRVYATQYWIIWRSDA
jgi:hypothetical protein